MPLPAKTTFVTFDVYGTLVDWETGIWDAFSAEAQRDGFTIERAEVITLFLEISQRLGWPLEPSRSGFLPDSVQSWPVFKETRPVLERLAKKYRLGLISN